MHLSRLLDDVQMTFGVGIWPLSALKLAPSDILNEIVSLLQTTIIIPSDLLKEKGFLNQRSSCGRFTLRRLGDSM